MDDVIDDIYYDTKDRNDYSWLLTRDFDRGFTQMKCDQRENGCIYPLPHYHCQICGTKINDDEIALREFHPCCSEACILAYNQ